MIYYKKLIYNKNKEYDIIFFILSGATKNINYTYDNNGNLIQDSKEKYFYDYKNRLVRVTRNPSASGISLYKGDKLVIAEYSYDTLGRRLQKTTFDDDSIKEVTKYTYAGNNAIAEESYEEKLLASKIDKKKLEKQLVLKETKENIYSNSVDDLIASIISKDGKTKTYFYNKNQLGSITSITDEKGKVVEEYKYDVFGKTYIRDGKSDNFRDFKDSKINNSRLFTGRKFDKEINKYYYRARYYDAETGRFISRDPIGQVDNLNLYSYVGNNPVNFVDWSGLKEKQIRQNIINWVEQQYIYDNGNYAFDTGFLPSRKCNLFVGDAYTKGGRITNYPRYDGGDNYPIANDLASKGLFSENLNFFTNPNDLKPGDIVAWKNTLNPGHSAIYWGKNINTGEDMVIYAGESQIKLDTLNNVTKLLQEEDVNPDNHQHHLDPIFRSLIY